MASGSERSGGGSHRSDREPSGDGNNDSAPDGGDATNIHDTSSEKDIAENNSSQGTPRSAADCESASEHGGDNGGTTVTDTAPDGGESDRRETSDGRDGGEKRQDDLSKSRASNEDVAGSGDHGIAHASGGTRRNSSGREEDANEPVVVAGGTTTADSKQDCDHPAGSVATLATAEDGTGGKKRQDEGESKGNGPEDAASPEVAPAPTPATTAAASGLTIDFNSNNISSGARGGGVDEHGDDDSSWDGGDDEDSTDVDTEKPWVKPSKEAAKAYRKVCIAIYHPVQNEETLV